METAERYRVRELEAKLVALTVTAFRREAEESQIKADESWVQIAYCAIEKA